MLTDEVHAWLHYAKHMMHGSNARGLQPSSLLHVVQSLGVPLHGNTFGFQILLNLDW